MSDLITIPADLTEMSVGQMASLAQQPLFELGEFLDTLETTLKQVRQRYHAALEQRYAKQAQQARIEAGKDFGVVHLDDAGIRVTVDSPKRVSWNQAQLAETARRIAASGERVEDYLDIEYSIPEARYSNWPPVLREQFEAARTVKPGKTSFRLALIGGGPFVEGA